MSDTEHILSAANFLLLCRLCGTETISQDTLINIFDSNGVALNIKSKIANCLGFYVSENDTLPKVICTECVENLEKFYEFKIKSNKTAVYLIDLLSKQISSNDDKPQNLIDGYQITETEFVKLNDIDKVLNTNHNFGIEIPQLQTTNNDNPLINMAKMACQYNISNYVFPPQTHSISHVNNVCKSKNEVKIQSNTKKSESDKKTEVPTEYKCAHCPRVCDSKTKLRGHLAMHSNKRYLCTICHKELKKKSSLTRHLKIHNKDYDHVCNYCGKGLIGKESFDYHIRTAHTKDFPFQCTKCDKKFPSKGRLKDHDMNVHNDVYNFICDICNKSFKTQSYLHGHKKIHISKDERKQFQCSLCNSSYLSKKALKWHIIGHTGELKFKCKVCNKRYKNKTGLRIHSLTHTGVKNHICDVCGKTFALSNSLVVHLRTHTGERPYKCDVCETYFTQKSSLNSHRKKSCPGKKK